MKFGIKFPEPALLLGLPGDNTRANFEEANRAFWRQTVIPLVARMQKSFAHWMAPAFGDFTLDYDIDRIDALASERVQEWKRLGDASFLTDDEKREAVGYGPMPGRGKFDGVEGDVANADLGAGAGGGDGGPGNNGGAWQNQPRVPAGQEGAGEWTSGGGGAPASLAAGPSNTFEVADVISVCVAGSRGISTDVHGNSWFTVTYDCPGGQSFMRRGFGRTFPGLVLNPYA